MLNTYLSDGVTPLAGYVFPVDPEAGERSAAVVVHVRNDGDTTDPNVLMVMRTRHPITGKVVATGVPPQDELWGQLRITGFLNPGHPEWSVANTDWFSIGAWSGLPVGDIPEGCTVIHEFAVRPPSTAEDEDPWEVFPIPIYAAYSLPLPPSISAFERGVLHGIGDPSRSGIAIVRYSSDLAIGGDYMEPGVSGPPDGNLYVAPGIRLHRGRLYPMIGETFTFDQLDVAAATLTAGQSYFVTFSVGAGVRTATKGAKGTSPTKAAVPAGDDLLGYVQIHYGAGGTVIDTPDIDWRALPDRFEPVPQGGLVLGITRGFSVGGGTLRFSFSTQLVTLEDDTTNYVWQLASGLPEATTTDEYPETTSLPLCEADAAGGVIVAIRDRRSYAGDTEVLTLRGAPPGSIGAIDRYVVGHERLVIDRTLFWANDNGTGTGGKLQLDLLLNGTTMFPSFATEDWRPFFAFDAPDADLTVHWGLPELVELKRGDVLELVSIENPTGGDPPEEVFAQLVCRKP